ncbi:hypothetical protein [Saccharopolyspora shandongensis]
MAAAHTRIPDLSQVDVEDLEGDLGAEVDAEVRFDAGSHGAVEVLLRPGD